MQSHSASTEKQFPLTICWCRVNMINGSHDRDNGELHHTMRVRKASVVQDAEVAGYDFVFQHGAGRDIDAIPVVGDDDDGALRRQK